MIAPLPERIVPSPPTHVQAARRAHRTSKNKNCYGSIAGLNRNTPFVDIINNAKSQCPKYTTQSIEVVSEEATGLLGRFHGVALAAVVFLAFMLRLYRLNDQSLWWDDFVAFGYLNAPSLQSHLSFLRAVFPEHGAAPLYYAFQYCAARVVGMNAEALRLLPVAFAVSAVPLLYGFVRYLSGRKAALLAALCLALSPQHIWYAQELRPYELITPLVVISISTFLRGYREGRVLWWAINLVTNALLVWTHLLTVFLILTEGLFLLVFCLRRFRRVAAWTTVQLVLMVPSVVSVLRMASGNNYIAFKLPPLQYFIFILGGDIVPFHMEIHPAWKPHAPTAAMFPSLVPLSTVLGWVLLAVFTGASAWAFARIIRNCRQQLKAIVSAQPGQRDIEDMTLLLMVLFIPGLVTILFGLSLNTVIFSSYFMYNQTALYAIVGIALMSFSGAFFRRIAVLGIIGLYAVQLLVFLPEVTRANWKGAASYIRENASRNDEIIDIEPLYPDRELAFYLAPDWPVRLVETFQAACDDSARILQAAPGTDKEGVQKRVWIVVQPFYLKVITEMRFDCATQLSQALLERGCKPSLKVFPGQNGVIVCMVEKNGGDVHGIGLPVQQIEPRVHTFGGELPPSIDYESVLNELGFRGCGKAERQRLSQALRESVDHWPLDERFPGSARFCCIAPILDLVCRGHGHLAAAVAQELIDQHPNYGLLHMALGIALLKDGKPAAAQEAFLSAANANRNLGVVLAPFLDALVSANGLRAAGDEAKKLEQSGLWFAPALRAASQIDGSPTAVKSTFPSTFLLDGPVNMNRNMTLKR